MSKALRHVHNQLDVEKQWVRAIGGLAPMTHLQRAQVWADLSSHTLIMDAQRAPVVLSQYKALYKAALKEIDARRGGGGGVCDESEGAVWDMLKEYKKALEAFKLLALTIQDTSSGRQVVDMGNNAGNPISTELMKIVMEKLEALAIRVTQLQDGNVSIAQLILDHQASISAIKSKLEAVAAQTEESVKVQETMNTTCKFKSMILVFRIPRMIGNVLALNFESPRMSSVSFIISRIKLLKKAKSE